MSSSNAAATAAIADVPPPLGGTKRESLNGCWVLDRMRGTPSMKSYLATMGVDPLAIQAHEKGEQEYDTYHTISLDRRKVKIVKRSRVNNDIVMECDLNKETITYLEPGKREKKTKVTSNNPGHLLVQSSLMTVNGLANVVDEKKLHQEEENGLSLLVQELSITNAITKQSTTTVRYFVPYNKPPPHLDTTNATSNQQKVLGAAKK